MTGTSTSTLSISKKEFSKKLDDFYMSSGRHDLPWRKPANNGRYGPYQIWVSEMMLQQTQVNRVIGKYVSFISSFPTIEVLAEASVADVIRAWTGLGYNRRALYMSQTAKLVVANYQAVFPDDPDDMTIFPGIGINTAAAIGVYAYNQPYIFVETNIRTVFLHHFFSDQSSVSDGQIRHLVAEHIDEINPRKWYWSLMDYGTYLKKSVGGKLDKSSVYKKQSTFRGSEREVRGKVLKSLLDGPVETAILLRDLSDSRAEKIIIALQQERMIVASDGMVRLAD